jgi:hypothetical protein
MTTPSDFARYIRNIPTRDLPDEAESPIEHFRLSALHAIRMVDYFINLKRKTSVYEAGFLNHLKGISSLAFFQVIAAFERFLKELAAECIDQVAPVCTDNRLKDFSIEGVDAFPHFRDQTLGRGLCEGLLWHNVEEVNNRFKTVLRSVVHPNPVFTLFDDKVPNGLRSDTQTLRIIFQLRHTIAHNVGILTRSDASKLERLLNRRLSSPRELDIDRKHVFYLQQFLAALADELNKVIADRLGLVLTEFHTVSSHLIDPSAKAQELASTFQVPFVIASCRAVP